jgi:hypothetical protein
LLSASPMLMQYRNPLGDNFVALNYLDTPANRNQIEPSLGIAPNHRSHQGIATPFGAMVSVVAPPKAAAYARSSAKSQVRKQKQHQQKGQPDQ